jgi:hypothetical protein
MGLQVLDAQGQKSFVFCFCLELKFNVTKSAAALSRGRGCFPADSAKLHFNPVLLPFQKN